MFVAGDGWVFVRLPDGSVEITRRLECGAIVFMKTLTDSQWVALIALMAGREDSGAAVIEAHQLHRGGRRKNKEEETE